ncbi:MAG TPA: His-Xaa-Ser system radical SAM maturase HxsC [Pyrinomonadaceae bacterium]|nr:His-Xaa-Ser system radical SAM maturase HxsC [Pyrinomonadaceae bacterium]
MKLHAIGRSGGLSQPVIGRITTALLASEALRRDSVLFWKATAPPLDTAGYLAVLTPHKNPAWQTSSPLVHSLSHLDYLSDGDVVHVSRDGFVRTLYRKDSQHNFILFTDQCNSYCLMCSQPPKPIDDSHRLGEHYRLIDLIDVNTAALGITGGEPTLFADDFIRFVDYCKARLPNTALHILTNGRMFYYRRFAEQLGQIAHFDLMLGIPLYSDIDSEHDFIVQAKGSFEETVIGFHHLGRYNIPIEIRIVVHKQTYKRLPQLAVFISRNFPFAAHVALMGLELTGFTNQNMDQLWIDPHDYQPELLQAVEILSWSGLHVSIYNHQLCVLDPTLWPYARKSISDWKNSYAEECNACLRKEQCGGFFQSGLQKRSAFISPIQTPARKSGPT